MNARTATGTASASRSPRRERWAPYAFVAVPVVFVGLIQGYTIIRGAWLSLTETSLYSPSDNEFVGLGNYREVLTDPAFRRTLAVTLTYVVSAVGGAMLLALGVATLLHRPFRGRGLARAAIAVPWAMPGVSVAFIFTWILSQQFGVLNYILRWLGIVDSNQRWLNDPGQAMLAIMIPTVWQLFPICSLVILAAMQSVSRDVQDAARQDGATDLSVFTYVTWPAIRPSVVMMTLFATIWSIRRFELIWILTQGGPDGATNVLAIDLYRQTFEYADLGRGATYGMVGIGLSLIVTIVYMLVSRRAEALA